ncbi:MAG: glycosyltransferase family 4 protein [Thermoguttaceae bacterium]|jgi:glycosyltransferase involved in cell wall biosynthesis|nr:glycosyltransferase family 4 protein [Thermoguttaceae bacterium]
MPPSDRIRVLHYFAFPGGGIGRYAHELITHMAELPELEIELACIPSYHYRDQATYAIWPGLREITHPTPWRRRLRFALNLLVNPLRAIRRARSTGAHILHLSTIPHVTFALWSRALSRSGLRLVATAHDVRRSQGLIWHRYELEQLKRLYRTCDALFVHSQHQKADLVDFAGVPAERVVVVPHGPYPHGQPQADKETLRRRYGIPLDKQVALFFGDIRPDKNLDLFLRAMAPFKDRLFLVVAGRPKQGTSVERLQQLAEELGISESVKWVPQYIPYDEVPNYLELCDWMALPYSSRFTSQSGVLNVAIAHRRPVLASALPTFCEVFDACPVGITAAPDDVAGLSRAIEEMLGRSGEFQPSAFDQAAARFSWESNVRITAATYRMVAGHLGSDRRRGVSNCVTSVA